MTWLGLCEWTQWLGLMEGFLQEAKWFYSGKTPTLEEYLENAKISVSAPAITTQTYFTLDNCPLDETMLETLYKYHEILNLSGVILRLADDIGTATVYVYSCTFLNE